MEEERERGEIKINVMNCQEEINISAVATVGIKHFISQQQQQCREKTVTNNILMTMASLMLSHSLLVVNYSDMTFDIPISYFENFSPYGLGVDAVE